MGFTINFLQLFECGVCVDLGGREFAMSEQFLHAFEVGSVVEHRGGEAVAEHVGRAFGEIAYCREAHHDFLAQLFVCDAAAAVVEYECAVGSLGPLLVALADVLLQLCAQLVAERDGSLFVALARYSYFALREVYRTVIERGEFGGSHAGFVEQY